MRIARLQSELQKLESVNTAQLARMRQLCNIHPTGSPSGDLVQVSDALLGLESLSKEVSGLRHHLSIRSVVAQVARAPMLQTPDEEDFV